MTEPKIIFISSSGRSGTRSFSEVFGRLPNVDSYHGPNNELEKANCLRYHGKDIDWCKEELRKYRVDLVNKSIEAGRHYVECSWFISAFIPDLVELFPTCRIMHLVRDGRDFVRSGMSRHWFGGGEAYEKGISIWSRDKWNPPKACRSRFEKICWLWAEQQRVPFKMAREAKIPMANCAGVLKFEDHIKSDINELCEWLGLPTLGNPLHLKKLNASNSFIIPHWKHWNKELVGAALKWMDEELEKFGYNW